MTDEANWKIEWGEPVRVIHPDLGSYLLDRDARGGFNAHHVLELLKVARADGERAAEEHFKKGLDRDGHMILTDSGELIAALTEKLWKCEEREQRLIVETRAATIYAASDRHVEALLAASTVPPATSAADARCEITWKGDEPHTAHLEGEEDPVRLYARGDGIYLECPVLRSLLKVARADGERAAEERVRAEVMAATGLTMEHIREIAVEAARVKRGEA